MLYYQENSASNFLDWGVNSCCLDIFYITIETSPDFQVEMILLASSLLTFYVSLVQADKVVMTTNGPVQGVTVESERIFLEAYLGVPYAEPPVGRLRFAKPVPKTHWKGVYDASRLPPPCIQNVTEPKFYLPDVTNMSEDCLYLNIWTTFSEISSRLKPVLFFIHGGAFNVGSSNMKIYDGAKMAARGDVVVVTINYRVGAMGFLYALTDGAGGNMGLRDMILALEWIKLNAAAFHADPENIVVMGQSAGAMAAAVLAISPASKRTVKRVILESGSPITSLGLLEGNARLLEMSQKLARLVGCQDEKTTLVNNPRKVVKCLKRVPPTEISRAEGIIMALIPLTFHPRLGDDLLPTNTIEMVRKGELKDTEVLIGINKNEGTFFLAAGFPQYFGEFGSDPGTLNKHLASQLIKVTDRYFGIADSKEVIDFYVNKIENGTSQKYIDTFARFMGDLVISCSTVFHAEFLSVLNKVYFYMFTHKTEDTPAADWIGVLHGEELQYLFGLNMFGNFTEEEQILSNRMIDRWISFAKTGNPNIPDEVQWPLFSYKNPLYLDISVKERIQSRADAYRCEVFREKFFAVIDDDFVQGLQSSSTTLMTYIIHSVLPIFLLMIYRI